MRTLVPLVTILSLSFAGSALAQEPAATPERTTTYYGRAAALGGGQVRTYVTVAKDTSAPGNHKVPLSLGVEYPLSAFASLGDAQALVLDLPNAVRDTPFQYMLVDWNPQGHPGPMYQVPHFDFHFYIQDNEDRLAIRPGECNELNCEDFQKAIRDLAPQYQPEGYINVGATAPFMGNHLIDPTSPEFNGQPFTKTFIYGTYDAQLTFMEPMITRAYLEQGTNECVALKLPQAYQVGGYYPTQYCIRTDAASGLQRVSIDGFVLRQAQ